MPDLLACPCIHEEERAASTYASEQSSLVAICLAGTLKRCHTKPTTNFTWDVVWQDNQTAANEPSPPTSRGGHATVASHGFNATSRTQCCRSSSSVELCYERFSFSLAIVSRGPLRFCPGCPRPAHLSSLLSLSHQLLGISHVGGLFGHKG